jgi:PRC-barrel domain
MDQIDRGTQSARSTLVHASNVQTGDDVMMPTDTTMISSQDVQGTEVYGPNNDAIGQIDHLMIDKSSGKVSYAVMSFGGFLGLGNSHYPLPWGALNYDRDLGGFRTNVTESQLKDAPTLSENSWTDRNWESRMHEYYGVPTYWTR